VIVVDNASKDLDPLPKEFPQVRWVRNEKNLGWGAANNQGMRLSQGKVLVLLNPDIELFSSSLTILWKFFLNSQISPKQLGPVGGKLLFPNGDAQPSCGPFPHLLNLLWRLILPPVRRRYYLRLPQQAPLPVDWVTGAFMAIQREVLQNLGGFDTDFFLYYEDVDLCLRAKKEGLITYYVPTALAYHHNPHAIRHNSNTELQRIIQDSRVLYFKKHRPGWEAWVLEKLNKTERGFRRAQY
jgi:GT2 family glycosyltransferase